MGCRLSTEGTDCGSSVFPRGAEAPKETDVRVVHERQLRHKIKIEGVDCERCKWGFPRAVVTNPVGRKMHSATLRLTCPWLVKHIDEYEAEGAVRQYNERMAAGSASADGFESSLDGANRFHAELRRHWFESSEEGRSQLRRMREDGKGAFVDRVIDSGFTGITQGKLDDVKCLHAHAADSLLRPGENAIGEAVLKDLQSRGVDVRGGEECWQQCNVQVQETQDSWSYMSVKNKSKLRARSARRIIHKSDAIRQREKQLRGSAAASDSAAAEGGGEL